MVPAVFLINGLSRGDWFEAFLFAVAVAVGLTPELLPMIVTVNLSKGAMEMARQKVIVKRLNAIQDFGAMDVLCTDKTGTLTEGRVVLVRHVDLSGEENREVLDCAYLNSHFQTGLSNLLDDAVLGHDGGHDALTAAHRKVDELPFDFRRRRMSVIVAEPDGSHRLICKGAVEEVLAVTSHVREDGGRTELECDHHEQVQALVREMSEEGFRLIALAVRDSPVTGRPTPWPTSRT